MKNQDFLQGLTPEATLYPFVYIVTFYPIGLFQVKRTQLPRLGDKLMPTYETGKCVYLDTKGKFFQQID